MYNLGLSLFFNPEAIDVFDRKKFSHDVEAKDLGCRITLTKYMENMDILP